MRARAREVMECRDQQLYHAHMYSSKHCGGRRCAVREQIGRDE